MAFIVPVIDLLRGQVVHAVRGERRSYQPIVSSLCEGSNPLVVARALMARCNSAALYVADLDALQGGARQIDLLRQLLQALPGVELWVDAGFEDWQQGQAMRQQVGAGADRMITVMASESLRSLAALKACFEGSLHDGHRWALSLDRRHGQPLDPAGCWNAPQWWPQRVIVMTLERVGTDGGPDLDTLAEVQTKSPGTSLIGAGGLRHAEDLAAVGRHGAHAWLVASALHDRRV